jgi:ethanolamine transporter EutH
MPIVSVTSSVMLAAMEPTPRPTFQPAGAGMLLAATTAASIGLGALVGWVAGNVGYGILAGAIVGVPAGVTVVYFRYRDALS